MDVALTYEGSRNVHMFKVQLEPTLQLIPYAQFRFFFSLPILQLLIQLLLLEYWVLLIKTVKVWLNIVEVSYLVFFSFFLSAWLSRYLLCAVFHYLIIILLFCAVDIFLLFRLMI